MTEHACLDSKPDSATAFNNLEDDSSAYAITATTISDMLLSLQLL